MRKIRSDVWQCEMKAYMEEQENGEYGEREKEKVRQYIPCPV